MTTQPPAPPAGPAPDSVPGGPATGPAGGPRSPQAGDFFDRIRSYGVVRPDEGRWAAGVCAGLARRWGMDPLLVRGLFVALGIVTGIGLTAYGLLWLFLPHPDGRIHAQEVLRGVVTSGFVGAVIFVFLDFPLSNWQGGPWGVRPFGGIASVALVGVGVWWFVVRRGHRRWTGPNQTGTWPPGTGGGTVAGPGDPAEPGATPGAAPGAPAYGTPDAVPPTPGGSGTEGPGEVGPPAPEYGYAGVPTTVITRPPRSADVHRPLRPITLTTLGAAALAAAGVLLWSRFVGHVPSPVSVVAAGVALLVVAVGIVVAGALGRRAGFLAPLAILLAVVSANGAAWNSASGAQTDVRWAPVSADAVTTAGYDLGAGRAVLDLTGTGLRAGATTTGPVTVKASVGAGELVIVVPKGVTTEVTVHVGLGGIDDEISSGATGAGNRSKGGFGLHEVLESGSGSAVIQVDANAGVGQVRVVPEGTVVSR